MVHALNYASCHTWQFVGNLAPTEKPVRHYRLDVVGCFSLVTDYARPHEVAVIELTRDGWGPVGADAHTRTGRLHAVSEALDRLVPMTPIDGGAGTGPAEYVELPDGLWVFRRESDGYCGVLQRGNGGKGAVWNPDCDGCPMSTESNEFRNMPEDGLCCLWWAEGGG